MLRPFIKWPGGKTGELSILNNYIPKNINNYYEPFLGGGSVYLSLNAKKYFTNDLCCDLIFLYKNIKKQNKNFYYYLEKISSEFKKIKNIVDDNFFLFEKKYFLFKANIINIQELQEFTQKFFLLSPNNEKISISKTIVFYYKKIINKENKCGNNLFSRSYLETIIKTAFYNYIRSQYHSLDRKDVLKNCYYLFIKNYCFGGLSRYNSKGEFNVPYSGSYNSKQLNLDYLKNEKLISKLKKTKIYNRDYKKFINDQEFLIDDFIFIDPPYDCMFSNYENNKFVKKQQIELSQLLLTLTKCKWMLVISETDFICSLYKNKPNIFIKEFNKEYRVNIKKRNKKSIKHLIITNYSI